MLLLRLIIFTLSFTFIFSNQLEFTNTEINAGETATIELNLDNPEDILGGFQFHITDLPNHGLYVSGSIYGFILIIVHPLQKIYTNI